MICSNRWGGRVEPRRSRAFAVPELQAPRRSRPPLRGRHIGGDGSWRRLWRSWRLPAALCRPKPFTQPWRGWRASRSPHHQSGAAWSKTSAERRLALSASDTGYIAWLPGLNAWSEGATVCGMTAKEKLRQTIEELSEAEAQDALGFIVRRRQQYDALGEMLESAPLDDEPTTPEEDEGVREAHAEIARGDVLSADEIRREVA
jgi:hypothetical protein